MPAYDDGDDLVDEVIPIPECVRGHVEQEDADGDSRDGSSQDDEPEGEPVPDPSPADGEPMEDWLIWRPFPHRPFRDKGRVAEFGGGVGADHEWRVQATTRAC